MTWDQACKAMLGGKTVKRGDKVLRLETAFIVTLSEWIPGRWIPANIERYDMMASNWEVVE